MKVVIDTVLLVRGLLGPFSRSGALLFEWTDSYEWIVTPDIVAEYLEVINRPKLMSKYLNAENRNLTTVLARIAAATTVYPTYVPAICRDPSDEQFLAAALTGNADFIVSEDNDLLILAEYKGVRICTAEAVLRELGRDLR